MTPDTLRQIVPSLRPEPAALYAPNLDVAFGIFDISTSLRVAAFVAQVAHETAGFLCFVEGFNYSAARLRVVWPRRFPDDATAARYARNPQKTASYVYAGRMGNGDEASGDGWTFRGRGGIQVTGRAGFAAARDGLRKHLGDEAVPDFEADPSELSTPRWSMLSAGEFWYRNGLNRFADAKDFLRLSKAINLGNPESEHEPNGYDNGPGSRMDYYRRACKVLGA